jgi:hypothetical protein
MMNCNIGVIFLETVPLKELSKKTYVGKHCLKALPLMGLYHEIFKLSFFFMNL